MCLGDDEAAPSYSMSRFANGWSHDDINEAFPPPFRGPAVTKSSRVILLVEGLARHESPYSTSPIATGTSK